MLLIIVFILVSCFNGVTCKYIPSKQVQVGQYLPLEYMYIEFQQNADQNLQVTYTFNTKFNRVPQILFSYFHHDVDGTKTLNSNFKLEVQNINQAGFQINVSKLKDQKIYTLGFNYLAIDSDDAYIENNQICYFKNTAVINGNKLVAQVKLNYKKNIDPSKTKRIMSAFYTGYDQTPPNQLSTKLSIFLEIQQFQDYAVLTITSEQLSNYLNVVYYNYIEYYQDLDQTLFSLDHFKERTFYRILKSQFTFQSNGLDYYSPQSSVPVDLLDMKSLTYGFTGFEIPPNNDVLRLKFEQADLDLTVKQFKFNYCTWQDTEILGVTSDILVFKQLDCDIYFDKQCVSQCPSHYYKQYSTVKVVNECHLCYKYCKECSGSEKHQCTSCYEGFELATDGRCQCPQNFELKQNGTCSCPENYEFLQGKCLEKTEMDILNKSAGGISKATISVTVFLTVTSNLTNQGNSMIVYLLTVQKVLYLLLVDIKLPYFFWSFLEVLTCM